MVINTISNIKHHQYIIHLIIKMLLQIFKLNFLISSNTTHDDLKKSKASKGRRNRSG